MTIKTQKIINKILMFLNKHKIFFILLFLIFLISHKTFNTGILRHTDLFYPFNLKGNLGNYISAWDYSNLGIEASSSFSTLTNILFIWILQYIFPHWLNTRILILLPVFLIGIFTYILAKNLFKKFKYHQQGTIISAIFSISNPVIYNYLDSGTYAVLFALAFAILFFHFTVKFFEEKKTAYIIYAALSSIFVNHLTIFALLAFLIFLYIIFQLIKNFNKKSLTLITKFVATASALIFLLNAYWITPMAGKVLQGRFVEETFTAGSDITWLIDMSNSSLLFAANHLRHLPYGLIKGWDNYQIIFSYIILICILSVLIFYRRNKNVLFFASVAVLFTILSLGIKKPLGILFQFLWNHFILFHGFRSTIRFLLIAILSFSILIGYFYLFLAHTKYFHQKIKRLMLMTILSFMIIVSIWPLYTGDVMGAFNPLKIPSSYWQIKKEIEEEKKQASILILPDNLSPFFSWADQKGKMLSATYFENNFFDKPVIFLFILSFSDKHKFLYSQFAEDVDLNKFLALYNIKYILLHKDYLINNDFKKPNRNFLFYKDVINQYNTIKLKKNFKEIEYYKIASSAFLPRIYIPSQITYIKSKNWLQKIPSYSEDPVKIRGDWQVSVNSGVKIKEEDNLSYRLISRVLNKKDSHIKNWYFLDNLMTPEKGRDLLKKIKGEGIKKFNIVYKNQKADIMQTYASYSQPQITFEKIHPTKYLIKVKNAKNSFPLIFSESFHSQWKIYLKKSNPISYKLKVYPPNWRAKNYIWDTWFKKPLVSEENHWMVNGYANGWWIEWQENKKARKQESKKNYDLELILEYWPQRLFYLGLIISIFTLLGCLVSLIYIKKQRKVARNL